MLTADQIQANRRTLAGLLRSQMNLPAAPSDWSYSQRVEYNKAFAAYVLAHPASFSSQDMQTADIITQEIPQQLDESSVSAALGDFAAAALDNARTINPLDPQNVKAVGMNLLIAAVILGAAYIIVRNWPSGGRPVNA